MSIFPKILIAIPVALSFCNSIYAQQTEPTRSAKHIFLPSENGCEQIDMFFKFTNEFKGDESVRWVFAKNFNMETTLPSSRWTSAPLPQGESITYKNTYTADQSILTGAILYSTRSKCKDRTICGITFYHDIQEYSCGSVIVMTGGNCLPMGGKGTEEDPYIFKLLKPD